MTQERGARLFGFDVFYRCTDCGGRTHPDSWPWLVSLCAECYRRWIARVVAA